MLRFKPSAKPRIADLRLAQPEVGCQPTLDPEIIQLQLDDCSASREMTPHIRRADVEPTKSAALALRFDHHRHRLRHRLRGWQEEPTSASTCGSSVRRATTADSVEPPYIGIPAGILAIASCTEVTVIVLPFTLPSTRTCLPAKGARAEVFPARV